MGVLVAGGNPRSSVSSINGGTWSRLSSLLLICSLALYSISISRLPTSHFMVVSEGMMKDIKKDLDSP